MCKYCLILSFCLGLVFSFYGFQTPLVANGMRMDQAGPQKGEQNAVWGFWAHRRINFMAVFTLRGPLFEFFKKNIDYLTEHAVDPDKRRYAFPEEAPRHYIDIDHYGQWPYDELPRDYDSAVAVFEEDTLIAYGILPWHLERNMAMLQSAFRSGDADRILRLAADLGHYTGDAHVPLHCTVNYNGELTGQKGIHGFWESRLPELFGENYDYLVGQAAYLDDVSAGIWQIILDSGALADSVLSVERRLNAEFRADRKYAYEMRGSGLVRVYSRAYSEAYQSRLNHMVEDRIRASVIDLGNLWFTAWVDAGRPPLPDVQMPVLPMADRDSMHSTDVVGMTNDSLPGGAMDSVRKNKKGNRLFGRQHEH